MIMIVSSQKDVASINIASQILKCYPFKETEDTFQGSPTYLAEINGKKVHLITLKEESVYAQNITTFFTRPELVVFISRHSSTSGTPTLSVHTPGNLDQAELGGLPKKVSISPANAMRNTLKTMMCLKEEMYLDYEVSYECTHHGPSLDVPTMFAELGSSSTQWSDSKAALAVAHATMEAILKFNNFPVKAVLGIGGPHYNSKFTRIALESEIAFGHMVPKHASPSINSQVLEQCVERTLEKVEFAILDWKGIKGEYKAEIVKMLEEIGLPFQKI